MFLEFEFIFVCLLRMCIRLEWKRRGKEIEVYCVLVVFICLKYFISLIIVIDDRDSFFIFF